LGLAVFGWLGHLPDDAEPTILESVTIDRVQIAVTSNLTGWNRLMTKEKKKNEHMGAGIAIGVGVGVAIGAATDNMGTGIGVGIAIGVAIGTSLNAQKKDKDDS
jgi:uncharacterized membrane protein